MANQLLSENLAFHKLKDHQSMERLHRSYLPYHSTMLKLQACNVHMRHKHNVPLRQRVPRVSRNSLRRPEETPVNSHNSPVDWKTMNFLVPSQLPRHFLFIASTYIHKLRKEVAETKERRS